MVVTPAVVMALPLAVSEVNPVAVPTAPFKLKVPLVAFALRLCAPSMVPVTLMPAPVKVASAPRVTAPL